MLGFDLAFKNEFFTFEKIKIEWEERLNIDEQQKKSDGTKCPRFFQN